MQHMVSMLKKCLLCKHCVLRTQGACTSLHAFLAEMFAHPAIAPAVAAAVTQLQSILHFQLLVEMLAGTLELLAENTVPRAINEWLRRQSNCTVVLPPVFSVISFFGEKTDVETCHGDVRARVGRGSVQSPSPSRTRDSKTSQRSKKRGRRGEWGWGGWVVGRRGGEREGKHVTFTVKNGHHAARNQRSRIGLLVSCCDKLIVQKKQDSVWIPRSTHNFAGDTDGQNRHAAKSSFSRASAAAFQVSS